MLFYDGVIFFSLFRHQPQVACPSLSSSLSASCLISRKSQHEARCSWNPALLLLFRKHFVWFIYNSPMTAGATVTIKNEKQKICFLFFFTQFNYSIQVAVIKAQCKQCVWLGAGGDTFVVSFSFVCLSDFQKVISAWGVGVAAGLPSHCVTSFVLLSSLDLDSISLDDQSSGSSRRGKLSSFRGHTLAGADRRRHLLK